MNSINSQNRISFTSRNHPIPTHVFHSAKGNITISEAKVSEYNKLERFVLNTAIKSNDQFAHLGKPENLSTKEKEIAQKTETAIARHEKSDNHSFLVAKDKKGKIIGTAVMSQIMTEAGELTQFYIDKKYRGSGLGKHFGEVLLDSVKGFFTDVLVISENTATGFYQKLGFQFPQKKRGERLSGLIAAAENAIPQESKPFEKVGYTSLNPNKTVADLFSPYEPE